MLVKALVILDTAIIGLSGAVVTGLFGLIAKHAFLNPADEAVTDLLNKAQVESNNEKEGATRPPSQ